MSEHVVVVNINNIELPELPQNGSTHCILQVMTVRIPAAFLMKKTLLGNGLGR